MTWQTKWIFPMKRHIFQASKYILIHSKSYCTAQLTTLFTYSQSIWLCRLQNTLSSKALALAALNIETRGFLN